ncbi:unnamed protein product [Paramecium octaurelia]|uniref:Uncharacterized protein n=1 Tax=Paramecium octaurelia TaxID=43137 RepID=A0A8S1X7S1_PAROT|nr:unnamed protein product [Paramecium octaurelia]
MIIINTQKPQGGENNIGLGRFRRTQTLKFVIIMKNIKTSRHLNIEQKVQNLHKMLIILTFFRERIMMLWTILFQMPIDPKLSSFDKK